VGSLSSEANNENPTRDRSPLLVPWALIAGLASEIVGFLLICYVLYLLWWPLPLAALGALLLWIPNRPRR
jgi:hypothetical protein